jgi:hypothetical protein
VTLSLLVVTLWGVSALAQPVPNWLETRQIGPFMCYAEFSLSEVPELATTLSRLEADLIRALGLRPRPLGVEVFLLANESRYRTFLQAYYPDVPYRRALYVRRNGFAVVMAFRSDQFQIDLRHECTHALLHGWLPYLPLWLDEGLAEYFEQPPARRAFGHPHLRGVRWQAFLGRSPSLEKLEAITDMAQLGEKEYRASWAWVHYLLHGPPEATEEFQAYLRAIAEQNWAGNLSERLRSRIDRLDESFRAHFRSWNP